MSRVITYKNSGTAGMFSQIQLDSGERVLISVAQTGVKICRLGFIGLIPRDTIWESSDVNLMAVLFGDEDYPSRDLLDSIVAKVLTSGSIAKLREILSK